MGIEQELGVIEDTPTAKVKTRFCRLCKKKLSSYNNSRYCFSHPITQIDEFEENKNLKRDRRKNYSTVKDVNGEYYLKNRTKILRKAKLKKLKEKKNVNRA